MASILGWGGLPMSPSACTAFNRWASSRGLHDESLPVIPGELSTPVVTPGAVGGWGAAGGSGAAAAAAAAGLAAARPSGADSTCKERQDGCRAGQSRAAGQGQGKGVHRLAALSPFLPLARSSRHP